MAAGTTTAGGTELPVGTVTPLWFRVADDLDSVSGRSALPGKTQFGTKLCVLFTPSSPGREIAWEPGTWYELRHLVHAPSRGLRCPDCGMGLTATDDTVHEAIALALDRDSGPQSVGTAAFEATKLGTSEWLTPVTGADVEPIRWTCPSCGYVSDTADERWSHDEVTGRSETLSQRVRAALAGAPASPSTGAADEDSHVASSASFRAQIHRGTCPAVDDITMTAVRSPYEFGATVPDPTALSSLSPTVAGAVSTNPATGDTEQFCEITFNASEFDWARQRPSLDLVFAIDISGSMAAAFGPTDETTTSVPSKLAAVRESLAKVVQRLDSTDRVGVVLFDTDASVVKPIQPVTETTHKSLRTHLAGVVPTGNTNPIAGLQRAGELFVGESVRPDTERRVILLSDTIPTAGTASTERYLDCCGAYRRWDIRTSFVCLGFPHAPRALCREAGTNVAVAEDPAALAALCRGHLDSILFPVAFDLSIDAYPGTELVDIAAASDPSPDGNAFHRKTVFPTGPTAQSLESVLLQLSDASNSADVRVTWTDRDGNPYERTLSVANDQRSGESFDTKHVRVNVALHRYHRALQAWCRRDTIESDRAQSVPDPQPIQLDRLKRYFIEERAATEVDQFDIDIEVLQAIIGDD